MIATQQAGLPHKVAAPRRVNSVAADPLDIYLKESSAYPLLSREEQDRLLAKLVERRSAWQMAFLDTPAAMEAVWDDLQRYRCGEIAASSLVPGPPRVTPGEIGPAHHVERLWRLFQRYRSRRGSKPFRARGTPSTRRLARAVVHIGFRPRPLGQYRAAALLAGGARKMQHVRTAHEAFLTIRRPLVEHNLRLVLKVARQFIPGPLPLADLIQEGNFGLIRATESFNPRFKVRFSTYAHLWIRQAVIRALEDKSRTIRLPVSVTQKLRRLRAATEGDQEASSEDGRRLRQLLGNPTVGGSVLSLSGPTDEEGDPLIDAVAGKDQRDPELQLSGKDMQRILSGSLSLLPERQRLVLRLRFGLDGKQAHTLSQIGDFLGLSAERVRQIQEQAFEGLRSGPDSEILEEFVLD